jgi:hypothetical protein
MLSTHQKYCMSRRLRIFAYTLALTASFHVKKEEDKCPLKLPCLCYKVKNRLLQGEVGVTKHL